MSIDGLRCSSVNRISTVTAEADGAGILALFAPTQLPGGLPQGWIFDILLRLNPVASALHYLGAVLVSGHSLTQDLSYLISSLATVAVVGGALIAAAPRLVRLTVGDCGSLLTPNVPIVTQPGGPFAYLVLTTV